MSQTLTASQLAYLASEYTQLASLLATYQAEHGTDPDVDLAALNQLIADVSDAANNLVNSAVATKFNDSASAFASLSDVTEHANATAASLAQERAQFSHIANIAASMIGLATALGSGNPLNVFTAIANCAKAIGKH
jgi:hypothetical protein